MSVEYSANELHYLFQQKVRRGIPKTVAYEQVAQLVASSQAKKGVKKDGVSKRGIEQADGVRRR